MLKTNGDTIEFIFENCVQCGACLAVCHHSALKNEINYLGLSTIVWSRDKCKQCGKCVEVCPAGNLPGTGLVSLKDAQSVWLVHARDEDVRRAASSGGGGRSLFQIALETNLVEIGYALKKVAGFPWVEGSFWKVGHDYKLMPNSIYHPVLALSNFKLDQNYQSCIIIGCPCQLAAAAKMVRRDVKLIKIAIYCKQQKHLGFARFVSKRIGQVLDTNCEVSPISYRGDGWPGYASVNQMKIPYVRVAGIPFGSNIWRVPGCRRCPNPYGSDVDITITDPWGVSEGGEGETLAVVWTEEGDRLLKASKSKLNIEVADSYVAGKPRNSSDELNKAMLVPYYAGKSNLSNLVRCAGRYEKLKNAFLEWVLDFLPLPAFILKIIPRLPDLRTFLRRIKNE